MGPNLIWIKTPQLLNVASTMPSVLGATDPLVLLSLNVSCYQSAKDQGDDISMIVFPGAGHLKAVSDQ